MAHNFPKRQILWNDIKHTITLLQKVAGQREPELFWVEKNERSTHKGPILSQMATAALHRKQASVGEAGRGQLRLPVENGDHYGRHEKRA